MTEITGPPAVSFYSMLSGLGDTIQANAVARQKQDIANARAGAISKFSQLDPNSPDYGRQVQSIASTLHPGDSDGAFKFIGLAHQAQQDAHTKEREGVTDSHWAITDKRAAHADSRAAAAEGRAAADYENTPDQYAPNPRAAEPGQPKFIDQYAVAKAAADADKFVVKETTNPDGTTGFTRIKTAGPEGPIAGAAPPPQVTDPTLAGPDYLKTLRPDEAMIVKKIADHEIDPRALSIAGGHRERLMAQASRYDPEYDASLAPARFAAKKEFMTGGPNSPASTIVSGGTTIGHLLHASDASQKLGGTSSFGPLNSPINQVRAGYEASSNDPNFKEYNTTIGRIAEEGTKFYRGVGGTESDIMRDIKTMEPGQSQESRDRALATQASLIYSKVAALQDRYKNAMGTKAWEKASKENNFPVISAKNREAVNVILKRGGLPELPPEPAKGGTQGNGGDVMLQHARDALALGAPRAAVLQRLQDAGVDPSGL